jgi:hypothetical protein
MPSPKATQITVGPREYEHLRYVSEMTNISPQKIRRARILMMASEGATNCMIAEQLVVNRKQVIEWRARWADFSERRRERWDSMNEDQLRLEVLAVLNDRPRSGRPSNASRGEDASQPKGQASASQPDAGAVGQQQPQRSR